MGRTRWIAFALLTSSSVFAATRDVNIIQFPSPAFVDSVSGTNITTIAPGDTVKWVWVSGFHGVQNDTGSSDVYNSGPLPTTPNGGTTFSHTFNTAGTFHYHCVVHGVFQAGTVNVTSPTATLSGTVNLGDWSPIDLSSLTFTASVDGGSPQSFTLAYVSGSEYSFTLSVSRAPHTVRIVGRSFLSQTKNVDATNGDTTATYDLLNGDTDGSNAIDDADLTAIILDYGGAMTAGVTDLNGDGNIDDADITIAILNFGLEGN